MAKEFLVKENSLELFFEKFQNRKDMGRCDFEQGFIGAEYIFIKSLPEIEECETVIFDISDYGQKTRTQFNSRLVYNVERYDDILLKLIKQK